MLFQALPIVKNDTKLLTAFILSQITDLTAGADLVRTITSHIIQSFSPLLPSPSSSLSSLSLSSTFTCSLRRFLSCYDNQFSIENDLITIQSCPGSSLDGTRVQYITDAIHSAHEAYPSKTHNARPVKDAGDVSGDVNGLLEEPGTSGPVLDEGEVQDNTLKVSKCSLVITFVLLVQSWIHCNCSRALSL